MRCGIGAAGHRHRHGKTRAAGTEQERDTEQFRITPPSERSPEDGNQLQAQHQQTRPLRSVPITGPAGSSSSTAPPSNGSATSTLCWIVVSPSSWPIATANAPNNSHTMKLTVRCNQAPARVGQCPLRRASPTVVPLVNEFIPYRPRLKNSVGVSTSPTHYTRPDFRDARDAGTGRQNTLFPHAPHLV